MKKNNLLKVSSIFILCISLSVPLSGCTTKDKEIVVAENVKEDLSSTNAEILQLIEKGNSFLKSGKFSEARESFEKAITKDKTNEDTYIKIKENYMNEKRFDDAYYIIKLAIDNNVSKDAMSKILEEIKANFSIITLEDTISKGDEYNLPSQRTIPVDTITSPVNIRWPQKNIDTSNAGTFNYDGYIDEYGRKVRLTLTIKNTPKEQKKVVDTTKEVVNSTKIGFIRDIYEEGENTLINFDEIQLYENEQAKIEYNKDNPNNSLPFYNHHYIRNINKEQKSYKLSKNCSYNLCIYITDPNTDKNSSELNGVSLKEFKNYVNTTKQKFNNADDNRNLLFWVTIENNIITKMNMQFIS